VIGGTVVAWLIVKVGVTWLAIDLISGVIHWVEDSYGHPDYPFVGRRVTRANLLHHARPRAFVRNSWYASSELLLAACVSALLIALAAGRLSPMVVLAAVLGANANQVHKWSHRTARENGPVIAALQRVGLIQSPAHHHRHHVDRKDTHYCVLTNLLNPVLDRLRFWRGLEFLIERVFGVRKRDDDAMLALVLAREPDFLSGHRAEG
jgi:ubiquitin-conjugating enzyme E2 variant